MNKSAQLPQSIQTLHRSMNHGIDNIDEQVQIVTLINSNGVTCTFSDLGATWLSCTLPIENEDREVLLGINSTSKLRQQLACLGATVGRFANRIKAGKFELDGVVYHLNKNNPQHCLHGGKVGFHQKYWKIENLSRQQVSFVLISPDGDQGFPGKLQMKVTYTLTDNNEVCIAYEGHIDKPCPVNMTNHSYFNLQDATATHDCRDHLMTIYSDYYVPNNEFGLPVGHFESVTDTGFDFRKPKKLKQDFLQDHDQILMGGYDHSFILDGEGRNERIAAEVLSPDKKIMMQVRTTMPAVQLYTGNFLEGCPTRGDSLYDNFAGFALETQFIPDSPNHPEWKVSQSILRPSETYQHFTVYQFNF